MIVFNSETYNIPDLDSDVEFLLNQNELHCNNCILIILIFNYMWLTNSLGWALAWDEAVWIDGWDWTVRSK